MTSTNKDGCETGLSGATGSLPALSVELLAVTWEKEVAEALALAATCETNAYDQGWNDGMARAFQMAYEQLRAEMQRANVRQPEENDKLSQPGN